MASMYVCMAVHHLEISKQYFEVCTAQHKVVLVAMFDAVHLGMSSKDQSPSDLS